MARPKHARPARGIRKFKRRTTGALKRCWAPGKRGASARAYLLAHGVSLSENPAPRHRSETRQLRRRLKHLEERIEQQHRTVLRLAKSWNYRAETDAYIMLQKLQAERDQLLAQ